MGLKLIANDADDLKIVASALQDAILRVGDIRYDAVGRSLSLRATRYRHEKTGRTGERVECGVRIDGVQSVRGQGLDQTRPDAYAVLLDMTFEETDSPTGILSLTFADGGAVEVSVEGLDLILADTGEPRRTSRRPDHGES